MAIWIGEIKMKLLDKYIQKKIDELEQHPELNKNRELDTVKVERWIKIGIVFFIFLIFFLFGFIRLTFFYYDLL